MDPAGPAKALRLMRNRFCKSCHSDFIRECVQVLLDLRISNRLFAQAFDNQALAKYRWGQVLHTDGKGKHK